VASVTDSFTPETLDDMLIWQRVAKRFRPSSPFILSIIKRAAWYADRKDGRLMYGLTWERGLINARKKRAARLGKDLKVVSLSRSRRL
jgi:hypothetical protein